MLLKKIIIICFVIISSAISTFSFNFIKSQNQLVKIAKDVVPAVVNISTLKIIKNNNYPNNYNFFFPKNDIFRDFFGDDFWGGFSPNRKQGNLKQYNLGSGVIISKDGIILTNYHVISGADTIKVILNNKEEFNAKIIGSDPKTDIAVLQIKANNLPIAKLGNSDKIEVGHWAIAIGNPFGLSQTITLGIISAKGRSNLRLVDYENFIQTDAAINPGNSGGALVNIDGEVIGINTAIFSRSGGYQGIGFAIPINMAKKVMKALFENGQITRGWLGVYIQPLTNSIKRKLDLEIKSGVLVGNVTQNSPASKAGIRKGDIITQYKNEKIYDVNQLRNLVASTPVGEKIKIYANRNGNSRIFKVKIGKLSN